MRAAQADRASVFDNSVERASRERTDSGISSRRSHKIDHCGLRLSSLFGAMGEAAERWQPSRVVVQHSLQRLPWVRGDGSLPTTRRQTSGFKREFDPGSESTLAACLTHASRTRKWSNP